ncbi:MAG: ATP-binding cassette domain-containing protein [Chloroflexi bacterium]|nr:MAG: ATP-binding cassette domain-containing protein [Chloroflexota bacterium]TME39145.1 MAG: ATP-binding cassette domain-containing protein [Chloroflexota bacterium]
MGSRPATSGRVGASKKSLNGRGAPAQKNGAIRHRPATNGELAAEPAVKLVAVSKSFGRRAVLKGVNFSVAAGELVEVTGPSGSGKTTLLRLLHGQLRANAGELWVRGRGLHRWWRRGLGGLRREVAFVFQEQRLLPRLNAFENLVLALQVRDPQVPNKTIKQRALEALESVKLADRRRAYPHQLSAGERQRVAIARALAIKPRILLADEPLNSVDEENAALITHLLEEAAAAGTTVIVATHRHTFAASRILRLPSEKVVTNGARRPAINANGHQNGHANGGSYGNGNGHANGDSSAHAWWRLAIPARERPRKAPQAPRLPLWRRSAALLANGYRLVVLNGLRSWSRDSRLTTPVIGTIALLLMLCGTLALVGIAVEGAVADQASQASIVRVYLAPGATSDAIAALKAKLATDSRVASVTFLTPEQALAEASRRPGLDSLASLSSTNPFPASLDVRVKLVTQVAAVARSVQSDPAVDPSYPTSYDPDTFSRLRHFALIAGSIAAGIMLMFAFIAYAVIANSMRSIAASRRQEVAVTRLLGARGWMVRGPFVVEGLMTGALAGALAAAVVAGAYLLAVRFENAIYVQVLPGVGATSVQYVLAAVISAGLVLGTGTALFGFRKARA